jgi:hypothetical protein
MKPSSIPALAAALLLAAALPACADMILGSHNVVSQERAVAGFHALGLSAPADVEIVQGSAEGATVTADDSVIDRVETVVENGVLKIRMKPDNITLNITKLRVQVRARSMDSIAVSGSGDVHAKTLDTPRLKVAIAGSGDVSLPALTTSALDAHISGSGDLTAAGRADNLEAQLAGSGDMKAGHLETTSADLRIAGSSDVELWVKKSLMVSVAGSGDVRYYGDPQVHHHVSGSGSIKRLGASPP